MHNWAKEQQGLFDHVYKVLPGLRDMTLASLDNAGLELLTSFKQLSGLSLQYSVNCEVDLALLPASITLLSLRELNINTDTLSSIKFKGLTSLVISQTDIDVSKLKKMLQRLPQLLVDPLTCTNFQCSQSLSQRRNQKTCSEAYQACRCGCRS